MPNNDAGRRALQPVITRPNFIARRGECGFVAVHGTVPCTAQFDLRVRGP